jgi:hypothetical protein
MPASSRGRRSAAEVTSYKELYGFRCRSGLGPRSTPARESGDSTDRETGPDARPLPQTATGSSGARDEQSQPPQIPSWQDLRASTRPIGPLGLADVGATTGRAEAAGSPAAQISANKASTAPASWRAGATGRFGRSGPSARVRETRSIAGGAPGPSVPIGAPGGAPLSSEPRPSASGRSSDAGMSARSRSRLGGTSAAASLLSGDGASGPRPSNISRTRAAGKDGSSSIGAPASRSSCPAVSVAVDPAGTACDSPRSDSADSGACPAGDSISGGAATADAVDAGSAEEAGQASAAIGPGARRLRVPGGAVPPAS